MVSLYDLEYSYLIFGLKESKIIKLSSYLNKEICTLLFICWEIWISTKLLRLLCLGWIFKSFLQYVFLQFCCLFSLKKRGLLYGYTFLFLFFILFGNLLRNKIKTRTYEVAPNPIKNLILVSSLSSHIFFCPKASKISLSVQLVKPKFSNKYWYLNIFSVEHCLIYSSPAECSNRKKKCGNIYQSTVG